MRIREEGMRWISTVVVEAEEYVVATELEAAIAYTCQGHRIHTTLVATTTNYHGP